MAYYGPNHVLTGREALRVAAVYHNHLDHDQALIRYQKGYELLSAATPRTFEVMDQLSSACIKLAREYSHRRDPEAQETYAGEYRSILHDLMCLYGEDITEYQKELISIKYYYFLIEEAKHALREGRIGDSQELNASIEQWAEIYGQDLAYRKAPVTELKIALLIRTGRLEDAEQAARENIQSTLLYRGEKYKDYLSHLELLADMLSMEKKTAEAYSIYEEILVRLQRDYPHEKKWIRKIMDQPTSAL